MGNIADKDTGKGKRMGTDEGGIRVRARVRVKVWARVKHKPVAGTEIVFSSKRVKKFLQNVKRSPHDISRALNEKSAVKLKVPSVRPRVSVAHQEQSNFWLTEEDCATQYTAVEASTFSHSEKVEILLNNVRIMP